MSALEDFLLARIEEDEATAKTCVGINDLARHINGAPIPRWKRDGMMVRSDDDDDRNIVRVGHTWGAEAEHIIRWDPARALAECASKRALIEIAFETERTIDGEWGCVHSIEEIRAGECPISQPDGIEMLQVLARAYADHPDFQEAWES